MTMTYIPLISATAAILAAIAFEAEANSCTAGSLRNRRLSGRNPIP
jgi:hypothetical protein